MFIRSKKTPIVVRVADRIINDTHICQLARVIAQGHTQQEDGTFRVSITTAVTLHAADGNEVGPRLSGLGITGYTVELVGDDNTVVDAATGAILAMHTTETGLEWEEKIAALAETRDVMLQGEWFERERENPVNVDEMIRKHVRAADVLLHRYAG